MKAGNSNTIAGAQARSMPESGSAASRGISAALNASGVLTLPAMPGAKGGWGRPQQEYNRRKALSVHDALSHAGLTAPGPASLPTQHREAEVAVCCAVVWANAHAVASTGTSGLDRPIANVAVRIRFAPCFDARPAVKHSPSAL